MGYKVCLFVTILVSMLLSACGAPSFVEPPPTRSTTVPAPATAAPWLTAAPQPTTAPQPTAVAMPDASAQTPVASTPGVVVYQSHSDGSVRGLRLDTGAEVVLADPTDPDQLLPWAPSPDGRSIAVITGHGWNGRPDAPFKAALWTVDVDASNPRKLLDLVSGAHAPQSEREAADLQNALVGQGFPHLAWTPDGQKIVLASSHEGQVDLYAVRADGGGARRLTNTPDIEIDPTLSPDGREVAYGSVSTFGTGAGWGNANAWVQPLEGGSHRSILGLPSDGSHPASVEVLGWARDGSVVAHTYDNAEGAMTIWVAGGNSAAQAIYHGPANNVTWNQQRGALAFTNNGVTLGGQLLIWHIGEDEPTQAGAVGAAGKLAWSPDGQVLLICVGELAHGDAGSSPVQLMLWSAGKLHNLGEGVCDQVVWAADGLLAVGGSGRGLVVGPQGTILRRLPEAAFPVGWEGHALLFFTSLERGSERWQLYEVIGERVEPLGAPIATQPIAPSLIVSQ